MDIPSHCLKLRIARGAGKRDNVPDILHAGAELNDSLEAKAEACVRNRPKPAQVAIPPVVVDTPGPDC